MPSGRPKGEKMDSKSCHGRRRLEKVGYQVVIMVRGDFEFVLVGAPLKGKDPRRQYLKLQCCYTLHAFFV